MRHLGSSRRNVRFNIIYIMRSTSVVAVVAKFKCPLWSALAPVFWSPKDWTGSLAMVRIARVSISMRELDRLKCIQELIDKQLKQRAVAERLGLTVRQIRRLVDRNEIEGPRGPSLNSGTGPVIAG
jgi:hypothetical protein